MTAAQRDMPPERIPSPSADWRPEILELVSPEPKASILLVDDREDNCLAMATILDVLNQNVVRAHSGREALRRLLEQDFAVILLDVNMPGLDGFETASLIRQRKNSEYTPIIFVTSMSDTETHMSRGYSLGAVDYILTPVVPEVLRTKVSVFVDLFKRTEQVMRQAERLRQAHDQLELRVQQRTTELAAANESLQREVAVRQRVEDEVRQLNGELEQRVTDRTTELVTANEELQTFTYSVAHDLRAPLRHIQAYAQILNEDYASSLPDEARQCVERIGPAARNLGQMVDDLLHLSQVARQGLEMRQTDLRGLVDDVVSGLRLETKGRQVEWRIAELPTVACDPGLAKLVFTNLLSNSVKYTSPRQPAVIEVGQFKEQGEAVIYVRDNGVGFSMESKDKLFGVFQRLHKSEDFEGTGVGLAIAARIVRKHGGRIWAEGAVDQGATFYFTLGNN